MIMVHQSSSYTEMQNLTNLTNKSHDGDGFFYSSHTQVASMIPCQMFNFAATLLSGKDLPLGHGGKVCCEDELEEKALHLSQHILYAICKLPTLLTLGSAFYIYSETFYIYSETFYIYSETFYIYSETFYIYSETRSKNLITLFNHLNESVSYDTYHCYLTSICEQMMDDELDEGIFPHQRYPDVSSYKKVNLP